MAKRESVAAAQALSSWPVLNLTLRTLTDEQVVYGLLLAEQKGRRRLVYMLRIHARFNRLRAERERADLLKRTVQ